MSQQPWMADTAFYVWSSWCSESLLTDPRSHSEPWYNQNENSGHLAPPHHDGLGQYLVCLRTSKWLQGSHTWAFIPGLPVTSAITFLGLHISIEKYLSKVAGRINETKWVFLKCVLPNTNSMGVE